jgi:hypothetical protein
MVHRAAGSGDRSSRNAISSRDLCTAAWRIAGSTGWAAIEAAPYEPAKLTAVIVGYWNNESFAAQLDRAIARSQRLTLLSGGKALPVEPQPAEVLKKPFSKLRRV